MSVIDDHSTKTTTKSIMPINTTHTLSTELKTLSIHFKKIVRLDLDLLLMSILTTYSLVTTGRTSTVPITSGHTTMNASMPVLFESYLYDWLSTLMIPLNTFAAMISAAPAAADDPPNALELRTMSSGISLRNISVTTSSFSQFISAKQAALLSLTTNLIGSAIIKKEEVGSLIQGGQF